MSLGKGGSATQLAELLELTPRRVQQLAAEGIFPKIERGRYPLVECVRAYVKYWQERAEGRFTDNALDQARLQREQLEIRKRAVEVARAEGSVVMVEHHEEVLGKLIGTVRGILLAIPGAWGSRVVGIDTPLEGLNVMTQLSDELVLGVASSAAAFDLEEETEPEVIPDDFPGVKHLRAAGLKTMDQLRALDDFTTLYGIGEKTAEKMEKAVAA